MIRCWEVVVQKWPGNSCHLRCVASVAGSFRPTKVRAMNVPKEDLEISVGCFWGMGSQREPPKHGYFWGHIRRKWWKSNQNVDSSQESQRNKARERLRLHQKEGGSHPFLESHDVIRQRVEGSAQNVVGKDDGEQPLVSLVNELQWPKSVNPVTNDSYLQICWFYRWFIDDGYDH
jgi:hypothetical protein